eukprot:TRINITY_DN4613_c0_g1_i1.p1 TRINITY_DN4613_c0_g1~~TRINITY_DN4613_c0_g1_i1.p1  ORF type:complete len:340 (+),score=26.61 TRINITY_DN4613_c0_g1_i1:85-1104(+)
MYQTFNRSRVIVCLVLIVAVTLYTFGLKTIVQELKLSCQISQICPTCPTCPSCPSCPLCPTCPACPSCKWLCHRKESDPLYSGPLVDSDRISIALRNMFYTVEVRCPNMHFLGRGLMSNSVPRDTDGIWPLCEPPNRINKECKALTFGISNDPGFENDLAQTYGCQVWGHDPTISGEGLTFHPLVKHVKLGLAGENMQLTYSPWSLRTLPTLMKLWNVTHLEVLKIDVEGSEWVALRNAIRRGVLNNVEQLLFEIHLWPRVTDFGAATFASTSYTNEEAIYPHRLRMWYKIFRDLHKIGFRIFETHMNPVSTRISLPRIGFCCFEVSMVNQKYFPHLNY